MLTKSAFLKAIHELLNIIEEREGKGLYKRVNRQPFSLFSEELATAVCVFRWKKEEDAAQQFRQRLQAVMDAERTDIERLIVAIAHPKQAEIVTLLEDLQAKVPFRLARLDASDIQLMVNWDERLGDEFAKTFSSDESPSDLATYQQLLEQLWGESHPFMLAAYGRIAQQWIKLGDWAEMEAVLRQRIEVMEAADVDARAAIQALADALRKYGRLDEASVQQEAVLKRYEQEKEKADAIWHLVEMALWMENFKDARMWYKRWEGELKRLGQEAEVNSYAAHLMHSRIYRGLNNYSTAIESLHLAEQALQNTNQNEPQLLAKQLELGIERCSLLLAKRDHSRAYELFYRLESKTKDALRDVKSFEFWAYQALFAHQKQHSQDAIQSLQKALNQFELRAAHSPIFYIQQQAQLARFLQETGDFQQAKKQAQSALDQFSIRLPEKHPQRIKTQLLLHEISTQIEYEQVILNESILIQEPSEHIRQYTREALPFCLKQIEIENFQCIRSTSIRNIPVDSHWIFLTGENGDGKSSVLQAIALGLYGHYDPLSQIILHDDKSSKIGIEYKAETETRINNFVWLSQRWSDIQPLPYISCYGPSRLQIQSGESMEAARRKSPVYSLFRQDVTFRDIGYWLKMEKLEGREARIQKVKDTLIPLLPNISDIRIEGRKVLYIEKGYEAPVEILSSGHKSIIVMVGDMMIRLFESQPEINDPKELKGIVLIDELEAHLHPKWQRAFPQLLSKAFPNIQFVASTHSILPFMGAPAGSTYLKVKRTKAEGTTLEKLNIDISNLLPNSLLSSPLFDLQSLISQQNQDISQVRTETHYHEIQTDLNIDEALKQAEEEGWLDED